MFIDRAKIYIKAGNGGNGIVSFLRLKAVANGGPDGGDGGNGGDVVFVCDRELNNLSDFYYHSHYRAENGKRGEAKNCTGKSGADLIVKVPQGTVIRDFETGKIIADMFYPDSRKVVLSGGRGGKGGTRFCTPLRRSPSFAQNGEITEEKAVLLELKTIADCGLVGFPNVGKSTLLSALTAARPKIANYPFTTLSPNLGVVKYYDKSFVIADIPGLIEGASEGLGLGLQFLRHIERTRMLVHVLDMSGNEGRDPLEDYETIRRELGNYSEKLLSLPEIVAANKMDLEPAAENLQKFRAAHPGLEILELTAIIHEGLDELKNRVLKTLAALPPAEPIAYEEFSYDKRDTTSFSVTRREDGVFEVTGGLVEDFANKVVLDDIDSYRWFERQLNERGVIAELRKAGAKDGDTVVMNDFAFDFVD